MCDPLLVHSPPRMVLLKRKNKTRYYLTIVPLTFIMITMTPQPLHVSVRDAKRDFSQLTNLVYYGGRRVVVTSRGKPKVAIVKLSETVVDLKRQSEADARKQKRQKAFEKLIKTCNQILKDVKSELPDPVTTLHQIRDDRYHQLTNHLR